MKIPNQYIGKEQAFIKHRLETYLERLFMIIGQHERDTSIASPVLGTLKVMI